MCGTGTNHATPADRLADLVHTKLGHRFHSADLALFLVENWSQVSKYAHAIHERSLRNAYKEAEKTERELRDAAFVSEQTKPADAVTDKPSPEREVIAVAQVDGSVKFYEQAASPVNPDAKIKLIKAR